MTEFEVVESDKAAPPEEAISETNTTTPDSCTEAASTVDISPEAPKILPTPEALSDENRLILSNLRFNYFFFGSDPDALAKRYTHNLMFSYCDIQAMCCAPAIELTDFDVEIERVVNGPTFRGAFVSVELEQKVTKYILSSGGCLHPMATMSGHIDHIVKSCTGRLTGFNTRVDAIRSALVDHIRQFGRKCVSSVLVIGTDYLARSAITAALTIDGDNSVSVIGHDTGKLESLVQEYFLPAFSYTTRYSLIISCIPVYMQDTLMQKHPAFFRVGTKRDNLFVIDLFQGYRGSPLMKWANNLTADKAVLASLKPCQVNIFVSRCISAHGIWRRSLIHDGELKETTLTKAEIDPTWITSKQDLFCDK